MRYPESTWNSRKLTCYWLSVEEPLIKLKYTFDSDVQESQFMVFSSNRSTSKLIEQFNYNGIEHTIL